MAEFTAKDVMTLRDKSGAGMLDCKKALTDANGDMDKAADLLRERGIAIDEDIMTVEEARDAILALWRKNA